VLRCVKDFELLTWPNKSRKIQSEPTLNLRYVRFLPSWNNSFPRPPLNFPPNFPMASFDCSICGRKCRSHAGLSRHKKALHPSIPAPTESTQYKRIRHQFLDGMSKYNGLCEDMANNYWNQPDRAQTMEHFSINWTLKHPCQRLWTLPRTHGLPSIRKSPNSKFSSILRNFKHLETDPKNLKILKNLQTFQDILKDIL